MKVARRFFICGLAVAFVFVSLCSCGSPSGTSSISEDVIQMDTSDAVVEGIDGTSETYFITDYGMLYTVDNHIEYYDFSTNSKFALCDKANCRHNESGCNAWYSGQENAMGELVGLVLYRDGCYMMKRNVKENTYDLIQSDLIGNNQRVIGSIDLGKYAKKGSWQLGTIETVVYAGDMAWYVANYSYADETGILASCKQYGGINLETGEEVLVTPKTTDSTLYTLEAVSADYLIIKKEWNELALLTKDEFEEALAAGEFGDEFAGVEEAYYEYNQKWYWKHSNPATSYLLYTVATDATTLLEEFPTSLEFGESGTLNRVNVRYGFLGMYEGDFLCYENGADGRISVQLWDVEKNEKKLVADDVSPMNYGDGQFADVLYDESKFLYVVKEEGDVLSVYEYDLATGQSSPKLFDEKGHLSLHLLGDAQDEFIAAKIGLSYMITREYEMCRISKEDYLAGKLGRAKKLDL